MSSPDIQPNKFFSKKMWKKIILSLVFLVVFEFICYPAPVMASQIDEDSQILAANMEIGLQEDANVVAQQRLNVLPENSDLDVIKTDLIMVTAYTSEVGQTDGNPCRTACGFDLCEYNIEDTVAANFLPFGTKIRMPEVFGDRVFIVRDRMNSRYDNYIDVWFKDKQAAQKFGIKELKVEILAEP